MPPHPFTGFEIQSIIKMSLFFPRCTGFYSGNN